MKSVVETLLNERLMILARGVAPEQLEQVVHALDCGGIKVFETTFSQADPDCNSKGKKAIECAVKAANGHMWIGAGTVLTKEQVQIAHDAGATFIVSPDCNPSVVAESKRLGLAVIPGALTPTEITSAWNMGADIVKLFPADAMGMGYIRNLRGPLPHIPLLATGGVNPDSIPLFFEAGINAVGTGITVVKPELVKTKNYAEIERLARAHIEAISKTCK